MCCWATISPRILSSSSVSSLYLSIVSVPACVSDDSEGSLWHCPKEWWRKPGWRAPHSLKSDLRWQALRPQQLMPHMLTVAPSCCVESLRKWHLTRVQMLCFALNMQPFTCKMFLLTSRPSCCLSLIDICLICALCVLSTFLNLYWLFFNHYVLIEFPLSPW